MYKPFNTLRDELKYLMRKENDPSYIAKRGNIDRFSLQPTIPSPNFGGPHNQPNTNAPALTLNDPLKLQIDGEMKFSSYQFQNGMSVNNNGGPQSAAELQNVMYAQEQMNNPNSFYNNGLMGPHAYQEPIDDPMQDMMPGPMNPLF
jgi:hypothetical protein